MANMTFQEFCHQRERMCESVRTCRDCGLWDLHKYSTKSCAEIMMQWPDKAESIVTDWITNNKET